VTQGWPPTILTDVTDLERRMGDGDRAIKFVEHFCRVTKDSLGGKAGDLMIMRGWQRHLIRDIFARRADGRLKHRQCYVGMPRKNGKSSIISSLALYSLMFGAEGGEIYCVAGSRDQARIVFGTVRRMVELDPDLNREITLYKDALHFVGTDSILRTVAADAPNLEGLNPTMTILDEVHVYPDRSLWDVFALAGGARVEPQMVGITTAGSRTDSSGNDSLAYRLYQYGEKVAKGEIEDASFYCSWWAPKKREFASSDPDIWKQANPGYGDMISPEDMEDSFKRTPEAEFMTKRLNVWVARSTAWLPTDAWSQLQATRIESHDDRYVLALDGSFNNDSTAVVACTIEAEPHLSMLGLWERDDDPQWRVDVLDVENKIKEFCRTHAVTEIVVDPYRWQRTMAVLVDEGLPVVEYPQSPVRMVPATQRFYEAVVNQKVHHDGDPQLARHMDNAAVKSDTRGTRIIKSAYTRKIDAAIASVMAYDRAAWHAEKPVKKRTAYGFAAG
jgi:phage terminase large subunit-like protein